MKIYTRKGDDGTTGLLYGGRVPKTSTVINANGDIDEAQACIGLIRTEIEAGCELDLMLVQIARDMYVAMAEVATAAPNRHRLSAGTTLVTASMVQRLETEIDQLSDRFAPLRDFVIPGANPVSARLDLARTVVRRAERMVAEAFGEVSPDSQVGPYLNRLSDLLWTMARWQEEGHRALAKEAGEKEV